MADSCPLEPLIMGSVGRRGKSPIHFFRNLVKILFQKGPSGLVHRRLGGTAMIISDSRKESLIRAVAAEARRSRGGPKIDLFVRRFFDSVPMDELAGRPVAALAAE